MKKKLILILLLTLTLSFSCVKEKEKIKVLLPGATPLVSIGGLLDNPRFDFEVVNGQDPLSAAFTSGEYDLIIAPINLGCKLYVNSSSNYLLDSVITLNNSYIISLEQFDITSLTNSTIVSFGTGSAPWMSLNALIKKYSLNASLINKNSVSDISESILSGNNESKFYLCDEPTTSILKLSKGLDLYVMDVCKELEVEVIFAALFVNPSSKVTDSDLKLIEDNINYLNTKTEEYANLIVNKHDYFKGLGVDVLVSSIPKCNITYLKAKNNLDMINDFYDFLNEYNPNVLNGAIPDENFYY